MSLDMLLIVSLCLASAVADVTIDLSTAELDKETGQFCVVQKVGKVKLHVMSEDIDKPKLKNRSK